MSLQKGVVVIAQRSLPLDRLVRRKRARLFEALQVTASTYLHCHRQFVSVQRLDVLAGLGTLLGIPIWLLCVLRIYVNQLHNEVGITARVGCKEFGGEWSSNDEIAVERGAYVTQYVRTMIHKPLVGNFPRAPVSGWLRGRDRARAIRNGICRVRCVF